MSRISSFVQMTSRVLSPTGVEVLPNRLHRKGLFIGSALGTTEISYAFGEAPTAAEYISIIPGLTIQFDVIIPANKVWVMGDGTAVIGEIF